MSIRSKTLAIFAVVAMGLSFVSLQARAAINTFDVGTVNLDAPIFGSVPPAFGSGSITGTFDFDDVLNIVTAVDFSVNGTTSSLPAGNVDGNDYSFLSNYLNTSVLDIVSGVMTVFRASESASPTSALRMSINRNNATGEFSLSAGVGRCVPVGGLGGFDPCGILNEENVSSSGVAQTGPGDFQPVPLPAPVLMLLGALGVFGAMAMRRRTATV